MKIVWLIALSVFCALSLSSCFLITVPVKATGEIIEKGAYATRDATARGIRRIKQPAEQPVPYQEPTLHDGPEYGSDDYYEE